MPGFQDWNLGLYKKFAINEKNHLEFRAEAFDVNNHPNWSGPGLNSDFLHVRQRCPTSKTGTGEKPATLAPLRSF